VTRDRARAPETARVGRRSARVVTTLACSYRTYLRGPASAEPLWRYAAGFMTSSTSNRPARVAAVLNGLLVFGVPAVLMIAALASASDQSWPAELAAHRPTTSRVVLESVQYSLVFAALGATAAWRTWIHAIRYQSGTSRGWQGVAEAAAVGFGVAVLYLLPGIITRPGDAPPYVVFYGSAAAILGAMVGVLLRVSAMMALRLSTPAVA